jgi:hypothetical protein
VNYDQCKEMILSALLDLEDGGVMSLFLAKNRLRQVLDDWPTADAELARLMKFETDARNVLGHPYAIQTASWKNADGSPASIRIVDEVEILRLLAQ